MDEETNTVIEHSDIQILDVAFGGMDERGESLISSEEQAQNERVMYGDLVLETAPKEGKVRGISFLLGLLSAERIDFQANTLLASALFSPSFFLAERIEMGLLPVAVMDETTVLELGAGAALPSLLLLTLPKEKAPSLIVMTDYPDEIILGTLVKNVDKNVTLKRESDNVIVAIEGYKWGDNPEHVLRHLETINK
ncbi:hypothetical protein Clacol_009200 [Clathrus columnatus]|uniref:Uncharacterized protein n=1 Tax=Clathrus columnatus TaxID=1419009 RepID=A0AAV5AQ35_9AGAM|nr:hypothetical protein Clacol_009200 [Clathrus columnatus]